MEDFERCRASQNFGTAFVLEAILTEQRCRGVIERRYRQHDNGLSLSQILRMGESSGTQRFDADEQ